MVQNGRFSHFTSSVPFGAEEPKWLKTTVLGPLGAYMQSYEDNQDGLNTRTFDGVEGAVDFAISLQADLEKVLAKPQTPKADIVRNAKNLSESIRVILFLIRMELKSRKLADTCEAELEREP